MVKMEKNGPVMGIDLGGTYIKAGLVDRQGKVHLEHKSPTPQTGQEDVLGALAGIGRELLNAAESEGHPKAAAIGLGTPGVVTPEEIRLAFNIPGWDRVPARRYLSEKLGLPVFIDNDANAFALGEFVLGAGKGSHSMIAFTIGTGVGGGIIVDGRVYQGYSGCAGELGHINVEPTGERCSCGRSGCLEAYASADAIARYTRAQLEIGTPSLLQQRLAAGGKITSALVDEAARQGDRLALLAIERAARYLGIAAAAVCTTLDPEVIVIGGGGAGFGRMLIDPMREEMRSRMYSSSIHTPQIRLAELGYEAGLVGAACLAWVELKHAGSA